MNSKQLVEMLKYFASGYDWSDHHPRMQEVLEGAAKEIIKQSDPTSEEDYALKWAGPEIALRIDKIERHLRSHPGDEIAKAKLEALKWASRKVWQGREYRYRQSKQSG